MPGLNQTGPLGNVPRSGRRMGRCTNFGAKNETPETPNVENPTENLSAKSVGRGFGKGKGQGQGGRGMGMGRKFRHGGNA